MIPVVLTLNALREVAVGNPAEMESQAVVFRWESDSAEYWWHRDDDEHAQRIVMFRESQDLLPAPLRVARREVYNRLVSFCERARHFPLSLPHAWGQFKSDNLITFFAASSVLPESCRWIAEVSGAERSDIILWKVTTSNSRQDLEGYKPDRETLPSIDDDFETFWAEFRNWRESGSKRSHSTDVELDSRTFLPTSGERPFSQWMQEIGPEQEQFIKAPSNHSIRLRGPAGSGKTLALELKVLHEYSKSLQSGSPQRILVVTHSWALAQQIADSLDSMSEWGRLQDVEILPLVSVAQAILPAQLTANGLELIGEDSLSAKQAQLEEVIDVLEEFRSTDWVTFKARVSRNLRERLDSDDPDQQLAFAWDCLVEFGSVIGADGIYRGVGAEQRYLALPRAQWMMPLEGEADKRAIFRLYSMYLDGLAERRILTGDQLLTDFLSYLETFAWDFRRIQDGYDLIFVDEFHLLSPLERQVLKFLARDVSIYPRMFMAIDPRQSPWEPYLGVAGESTRSSPSSTDDGLGHVEALDLSVVHRFTPEILEFVKHIHLDWPNLNLGQDWSLDLTAVESGVKSGPIPRLVHSGTRAAEEIDIYSAVARMYPAAVKAGSQLALAVVDPDQFSRYRALAERIGQSDKYRVTVIAGRQDVDVLQHRKRGLVVGPAEYLAGLQFDSVLVAGIPDLRHGFANMAYRRSHFLSLLYLAVTRAKRNVAVFINDEIGGCPEVLDNAAQRGILHLERGSEV